MNLFQFGPGCILRFFQGGKSIATEAHFLPGALAHVGIIGIMKFLEEHKIGNPVFAFGSARHAQTADPDVAAVGREARRAARVFADDLGAGAVRVVDDELDPRPRVGQVFRPALDQEADHGVPGVQPGVEIPVFEGERAVPAVRREADAFRGRRKYP